MGNLFRIVIMSLFAALFVRDSPLGRFELASRLRSGRLLVIVAVLVSVSSRAGLAIARADGRT